MSCFAAVITTIQPPTHAVEALAERLPEEAGMVVAGDKKGPERFDLPGVRFLSLQDQLDSGFTIARILPVGHYARKNVAYLDAIAAGATSLYETDDDNAPLASWALRSKQAEALAVQESGWINAYRFFSKDRIWPRGFPLNAITSSCKTLPALATGAALVDAPIQQGLANNSPDVDAIWRLVLDRPFDFDGGPSIYLPPGAWCPFNSQSTWWWPEAYPLLYLPSYCTFRMTDIWRSFIAQRCLWELDKGIVFHAPEVVQDRNEHDLMRDFNDEVPGYQRNEELVRILEGLSLDSGDDVGSNMRRCYEALIADEFFPAKELKLVDAWLEDLANVSK